MDATFPAAIKLVLDSEGGFVDNPRDPGGATNMGITRRALEAWRGKAVSVDDVRNLTKTEAQAIYRARYWNAVHGDDLPAGVDYATFDFAVNSGPLRAVKALQLVLGVPVDGLMGPVTLAAARKAEPVGVINALCDNRLAYLKRLSTFATFGRGWTARVRRVRAAALAMLRAAPAPTPIKPAPAAPDTSLPRHAPIGIVALVMGIVAAVVAYLKAHGVL